MQILSPILPLIARAFVVGIDEAGHLVAAYSFASAAATLPLGPATERYGARRIMVGGLAVFCVGEILSAAAPDFATLLCGRVLAGMGGGASMTMCHVYIAQVVTYEERGSALGKLGAGFFAATIFGIPVGAFLADHRGWRMAFVMLAVLSFVALAALRRLPEPARAAGGGFRFRDYLPFIRRRGVPAGLTVFAFAAGAMLSVTTYAGAWLAGAFRETTSMVGLAFLTAGAAAFCASFAGGKWADRYGKKKMGYIANVFLIAVLGALPFAPDFYAAVFGFSLVFVAASIRFPALMALVSEIVPLELRGPMLLSVNTAILFGGGLSAIVAGDFYQRFGFGAVCAFSAALTLAVCVALSRLEEPPA